MSDAALPAALRQQGALHAVGRLDQNTSGLLLLTTDGRLLHHVTNPTAHSRAAAGSYAEGGGAVSKTYVARVARLNASAVERLRRGGVGLGGGLGESGPAEVELLEERGASCTLRLTLREGKNRQVRRMLHGVGYNNN